MMPKKEIPEIGSIATVSQMRIAAAALLFASVSMLAIGVPQASAQTTCPALTQGFWKNHQSAWRVTSLTLGTTNYTAAQLETILTTPAGGDASLILAHQLIAALLNIANGTDPSPVSATILDANTLLGAGPIPEGIKPSSPLGQEMVNDAAILENFNQGNVTQVCAAPQGSCAPSGSLSVLVSGTNVVAYVAKGNWGTSTTGVSAVNVEGSSITNTLIPTANAVNSCASNPFTGQTVCTANNTDVYLLTGVTLGSTLASGGSSVISFSGGNCTNCTVAMDAIHNKVVIGLSISGVPGFQFLDLGGSPSFEPAFASLSGLISEGSMIDPSRNLLLSAAENNTYEIVNVATSTTPAFFENPITVTAFGGELDYSGEDCTTGIALAPVEFSDPSNVYIGDLTQATFTPGTPGTWTAPAQVQSLSESALGFGIPTVGGVAVAQGTHTGVVAEEFTGDFLTAIALPTTSGAGTPAISDWVTCETGSGFSNGFDPHTVTAYKSPSTGDAIAVLANFNGTTATTLAVVDLTKMLNPAFVPRTGAGHGCASGTLPGTVVSFIAVP